MAGEKFARTLSAQRSTPLPAHDTNNSKHCPRVRLGQSRPLGLIMEGKSPKRNGNLVADDHNRLIDRLRTNSAHCCAVVRVVILPYLDVAMQMGMIFTSFIRRQIPFN